MACGGFYGVINGLLSFGREYCLPGAFNPAPMLLHQLDIRRKKDPKIKSSKMASMGSHDLPSKRDLSCC
jgi:hypothetical protein